MLFKALHNIKAINQLKSQHKLHVLLKLSSVNRNIDLEFETRHIMFGRLKIFSVASFYVNSIIIGIL